jgi:hypothetical protein
VPLFENMNEDSAAELRVRLLGEGIGCSRPTKAINIGDGLFQLDATNLYVAMTRGSRLLVLCSKTMPLNPRPNEKCNFRNQHYLRWLLRPHQNDWQ